MMDQHYYLSNNAVIQQPSEFVLGCTELNANQIKLDEMSKLIHELQTRSDVMLLNHALHSYYSQHFF
jgi:hypothetical protein